MRDLRVRNILSSAFYRQTDLDAKSEKLLYEQALQASDNLRAEIKSALKDSSVDWKEMLLNSEYEVYEAADSEDAIRYARRILSSIFL